MEVAMLIVTLLILFSVILWIALNKGIWYAFLFVYTIGAVLLGILMRANYGTTGIPIALVYAGQLFTLGINGKDIYELSENLKLENKTLFMGCLWGIYVIAPIISVSAIMKFIKKRLEKTKLWLKFFRKIYIFTEKNPGSVALASDIRNKNRWAVIVFLCETNKKDIKREINIPQLPEKIFEKINGTNEIHMCFIDEDDDIVLDKLTNFIQNKKKNKKAEVYVFTENETSEEAVDTLKDKNDSVHIRIIDMKMVTIREILWDYPLFSNAKSKKKLDVTVLGVGAFGGCFAANSLWCGCMPDCKLRLNLVDSDLEENVLRRVFKNKIKHNFDIQTVTENVNTNSFFKTVKNNERLMDSDYIMVSVSSDDVNIEIARELRLFFSRKGKNPFIVTYVRNQSKYNALHDILKKEGIELVGGINNMYSAHNVFYNSNFSRAFEVYKMVLKNYRNTENTDEAENTKSKKRAKKKKDIDGTEDGFYSQKQVYINSSYASAIHCKYKIYSVMGRLDGSRDEINKNIKENRLKLAMCEHERWMAFEILKNYRGISKSEFERFVAQNHENDPENEKPHKNESLKISACITPYENLDYLADIVSRFTVKPIDFKKNDLAIVDNTAKIWWA